MLNPMNDNQEIPKNPLADHEAAYVDAMLEHGNVEVTGTQAHDHATCPPRLTEIIHALAQLPPVEPPADLTRRTVAAAGAVAVPRTVPHAVKSMLTNTRLQARTWDPRKADIAVMLVAAALLLTVTIFQLNKARTLAVQTACANNLAMLATAFGQYSANNNRMLPSMVIPADHDWLPRSMTPQVHQTTDAHCNLANLSPMLDARTGYTSWTRMLCPAVTATMTSFDRAGEHPAWSTVGYSYIDQLSAYHHHWAQSGHVAVLADRNPLFYGGGAPQVNMNSWNHKRLGQNVLYDDGSVFWTRTPDVGPRHDNIWTLGSPPLLVYSGVEEPTSRYDIILVP
jgi:hypothetical protein